MISGDTWGVGVFWARLLASVRETWGVRERSAASVVGLLLIASTSQGVAYIKGSRSEAAVAAVSQIGRLGRVASRTEVVARRLEVDPQLRNHQVALVGALGEIDSEETALADAVFEPPVDNPGWSRVALALTALEVEARGARSAAALSRRDAQRLRARAIALGDEVAATRDDLLGDIERSDRWLRGLSWASWLVLMASIIAAFRWVFVGAMRRIEQNRADLADAERAVLDAADGERVRLGQELHDGLCQQLGGLRLLALATRRSEAGPSTQASLQTLEDLAARSLDMARALSHGLYPGDVRAANLPAALERLGTELAELGNFAFSFEGPDQPSKAVSDVDAMQLYRIAQEAVSNAIRHGDPTQVRISLACDPLTLVIEDDGVGLSSTSEGSTTAGVGLSSMHARARAVDAHIQFYSTPREGTRVVIARTSEPVRGDESVDEIPVNPLSHWTNP